MIHLDDLLFYRLPNDAIAICPLCWKQPVCVIGEIDRAEWNSLSSYGPDRLDTYVLSCCGYEAECVEYLFIGKESVVYFFRPYLIRPNDSVDNRAREDVE
jgi:hypothetical protein